MLQPRVPVPEMYCTGNVHVPEMYLKGTGNETENVDILLLLERQLIQKESRTVLAKSKPNRFFTVAGNERNRNFRIKLFF